MRRSRSSSSSSKTSGENSQQRNRSKRRQSSASSNDDRQNRRPRTQPPPKSKCLGVFGLSSGTTEDKIYEIFSKYGKIKRINVIFDTKTGRSRGFCFVYFKHQGDARDAKESCSGMEIDYRRIRVDYSITTRPHEPTPGVYKGRSTRNEPSAHRSDRSDRNDRSTRRRSPPYSPEPYKR